LREKICSGNAKLINMSHKQGERVEEMASLCCTPPSAQLMKNKWVRNARNNYLFSRDLEKTS
jgi:hypothetical protein